MHIVTIPSFSLSLFFFGRRDKGGVGFLHDKSLCFQAGISQLIKYLLKGILREFAGSPVVRTLPVRFHLGSGTGFHPCWGEFPTSPTSQQKKKKKAS